MIILIFQEYQTWSLKSSNRLNDIGNQVTTWVFDPYSQCRMSPRLQIEDHCWFCDRMKHQECCCSHFAVFQIQQRQILQLCNQVGRAILSKKNLFHQGNS